MSRVRKLLCRLGFHRFEDTSRQTFCLNNPSHQPLEFNSKIYSRCSCGAEQERWCQEHYLNNDRRVAPWGGVEIIQEGRKRCAERLPTTAAEKRRIECMIQQREEAAAREAWNCCWDNARIDDGEIVLRESFDDWWKQRKSQGGVGV